MRRSIAVIGTCDIDTGEAGRTQKRRQPVAVRTSVEKNIVIVIMAHAVQNVH